MKTLALSLLLLLPQDSPGLRVAWIDVEGGAATLVVTPGGESLMMDCGWPGERDVQRIAKAVAELGLKRIDHFLTSHWHTDHWGCVEPLSKAVPIGRFYDHDFPDASAKDVDPKLKEAYLRASEGKRTVLKPGDTLPLKGVELKVLASHGITLGEAPGSPQVRPCQANPPHPPKPEDTSDNARSLGWVLSYGDFQFLNLGDLTWNVEHKLVCPENRIGTVDVYQATHHGLDASNNPALLAAVKPAVIVINNGPKKGGTAAAFRWFKGLDGVKDIFALHRNVGTKPEDNPAPELVANDEEKCAGAGILLTVAAGGKSYRVAVPSKGTSREYATR